MRKIINSPLNIICSKKLPGFKNAGFSLLSHFIGLFLIIFTQVLGSFSVTKLLGNFNAVCFFIYPTKKSSSFFYILIFNVVT